jgi:hypothetical protein
MQDSFPIQCEIQKNAQLNNKMAHVCTEEGLTSTGDEIALSFSSLRIFSLPSQNVVFDFFTSNFPLNFLPSFSLKYFQNKL